MPPKKGKGKKGKGKKGKKSNGELTDDDKHKRTLLEVEILKDRLAFRNEFSRRSKAPYEEMRSKMDDTNTNLEELEHTHKSANAFLTNQYKILQVENGIKIHNLESELNAVRKQLDDNEQKLKTMSLNSKQIINEKEERINDLQRKIENMEIAYESIIHNTFDSFIENLNESKTKWSKSNTEVQAKNKKLLTELGFNVHDL
jgi:tRNA/tmRNA/rRNA uracil-C5-methylase (TrmA/RlmC/RlmD family)